MDPAPGHVVLDAHHVDPDDLDPDASTPTHRHDVERAPPAIDPAVVDAAAALRSSVESMDTSDEAYAKTAEKLLKDQDDIDQAVADDDSEALSRAVDHFSKTYDKAVDKQEISEEDAQQVGAALDDLQSLLG